MGTVLHPPAKKRTNPTPRPNQIHCAPMQHLAPGLPSVVKVCHDDWERGAISSRTDRLVAAGLVSALIGYYGRTQSLPSSIRRPPRPGSNRFRFGPTFTSSSAPAATSPFTLERMVSSSSTAGRPRWPPRCSMRSRRSRRDRSAWSSTPAPISDHVGGNAVVGGAGIGLSPDPFGDGNHATVLAHENVLRRMSGLGTNGAESPFPTKMLPNDTFTSRYRSMYVNDDAVQVIRQTGAHSDSDVMVLFRKADVIATGDILDCASFPSSTRRRAAASRARSRRSTGC